MLIWYKNSFLASIVSIIGCAYAFLTVFMITYERYSAAIYFGIFAVVCLLGGKYISDSKAFRKWWKQIEDAQLEPEIRKSMDFAVEIYKKNPKKRTLNKIRELNPEAAAYIENRYKLPL